MTRQWVMPEVRWLAGFLLGGIAAMTNAAEVIVFAAGSLRAPSAAFVAVASCVIALAAPGQTNER